MWVLAAHSGLYYVFWACNHEFWQQFIDWGTISGVNNFAGTIAWGFALALWATSISWVRRRFFEVRSSPPPQASANVNKPMHRLSFLSEPTWFTT